jgi:hypothetical protein
VFSPRFRIAFLLVALQVAVAGSAPGQAIIADHRAVAEFDSLPVWAVELVKTNCDLFYGHTSHGSQIVTGMGLIREENGLFDYNNGPGTLQMTEYSDDLGHNGDTTWVPVTRQRLDQAGSTINVVMWSWCGGCSDNTEEGINIYLQAMSQLEQDYPHVTFIYMTGHLDGTGPSGNLYARNNQIRDYCASHDKVLFDFADIESWDPDGNYYPDESDACSWCSVWCAAHLCPTCPSGCAHSHCFNCYLKGKAFWTMMARTQGWQGVVGSGEEILGSAEGAARLLRSRPNPFSGATRIEFSLPAAAATELAIFDVRGQKVAVLVARPLAAGLHTLHWDGKDSSGREVSPGTYFCRLRSGGFEETRKLVLVPRR